MLIVQLLILAGLLYVAPLIAGLLPARFMDEKHRSLGMAYVSGWIMIFGLFQLMIIPFIVAERDFDEVSGLYRILFIALLGAGILFGHKTGAECLKNTFHLRQTKRLTRILWIAVAVLVIAQMAAASFLQYLDGDDALYVTISLQTQSGDGMYLTNPYYGYAQELDVRHALSAVPIFITWLGKMTGLHTTILAHCFIGPAFLLLMYVLYSLVAERLLADRPDSVPLFMLFLNLWYLFGNVSLYTAETFAYTRTWQGKSMFGNLVVPAMLLWMLFVVRGEMRSGEWCLLFMLAAVAAFTTSTGIFMFPIFMALSGIMVAICRKKLVLLFEFAVCCTPSVVYGILYMFLK